MASISCNYTVHLSEQKGLILGQVKGSGTAQDELVGRPSFATFSTLGSPLYLCFSVFFEVVF